ncbi:dynamin family protein [Fontivita pretiosa]|uniref:dynamin family protein n=1 Tax=Fontivita pretiosa TaxID=2989684 RepID=UPI003D183EB1
MLRELERIITAHGLVEYRPALEAIVERLESPAFEIALFGRVSCGKSSLLNHILGTNALPVGVTPVTSIPTRVTYGPQQRAIVWFAEANPVSIEVERLAEFVTEQRNPGNARHVSRVQVELPCPLLRDGITFVDTPGVGSLASTGTAESVAYLPRCDLGIVLIDAACGPTHEDMVLSGLLRRSGAAVSVLLSKADLLSDEDRQRLVDYVRQQFERELHEQITAYPVSVKPQSIELFDRWFNAALRPALKEHTLHAEQSLARKIHGLRDRVIASLSRRVSADLSVPDDQIKEVTSTLSDAILQIDCALRARPAVLESLPELAARAVHEVARDLVMADGRAPVPGEQVARLIDQAYVRCCRQIASIVSSELQQQRERLAQSLSRAASLLGHNSPIGPELPAISGMPVPSESAGITISISTGRMLARFRRSWAIHAAGRKLQRQAGPCLLNALRTYAQSLERWRGDILRQMRRRFEEQAELVSAVRAPRTQGSSETGAIQRDLEALKRLQPAAAASAGL